MSYRTKTASGDHHQPAASRADGAQYDHVLAVSDGVSQMTVPGFLIEASFERLGPDLLLVGPDGITVLLPDYFATQPPPALVTADGALLPPDLVATLAGPLAPGQYADADAAIQAQPIGRVTESSGDITVTRLDGTTEHLAVDSLVFQGDVVETDAAGAISITFADETVFSLGENARMVLDEFVFDPTSLEGSSTFSVLEGVFVFVSGEVAANNPDDMIVRTPVATIGVRGTIVAGQSAEEGQLNTAVLLPAIGTQQSSGAITYQTAGAELEGELPIVLTEPFQAASAASVFDTPAQFEISPGDVGGFLAQILGSLPGGDLIRGIQDTIEGSEDSGFLSGISPAAGTPQALGAVPDFVPDLVLGALEPLGLDTLLPGLDLAAADDGSADAGGFAPEPVDEQDIAPAIDANVEVPGNPGLPQAVFDAVAVNVGGEASGELSPNEGDFLRFQFFAQPGGDADAFAVNLLAGVHYTAHARGDGGGAFQPGDADFGGTLNDPLLFVLDTQENGFAIIGQDDASGTSGFSGQNALVDFTAPGTGTHFLHATSLSEFISGSFTVAIEESFVANNAGDLAAAFDGDAAGQTNHDVVHVRFGGSADLTQAIWTNAEKIDAAAGGFVNTLILDPDAVAALSGANALIVGANDFDTVDVGDGWSFAGINGNNFVLFDGPGGEALQVRNGPTIIAGLTGGDDAYGGTEGADIVDGFLGDDAISGGNGADELFGGGGNDTLDAGNDGADDILEGGDGDDILRTDGFGDDELFGDDGDDTLDASGSFGENVLLGGAGNDTLIAGFGSDALDGGTGDDDLSTLSNGATASFASAAAAVIVDLGAGTAIGDGNDTLSGFTRVDGSDFGDTITGTGASEILDGGDGGDTILGLGGNDVLDGGDGDDIIDAGDGNDTVVGGLGDDDLDGGNGSDIVDYQAATGAVIVNLDTGTAEGADGNDSLANFTQVVGSSFGDTITGDAGANSLSGNNGADTIGGLAGVDQIFGGNGNDIINGGDARDIIFGGNDNDTLNGDAGNDTLRGEFGNDVLNGGAGDDELFGGPGNDAIDGGDGIDVVRYDDFFFGAVFVDLFEGLAGGALGDDTIVNVENIVGSFFDDFLIGDAGDNVINGSGGLDGVSYEHAVVGVEIDLVAGTAIGDGNDTLISIEHAGGGDGNDSIFGNAAGNSLFGGDGLDVIDGGGGDDVIDGGTGDDQLDGQAGFDFAAFGDSGDGVDASLLFGESFSGEEVDGLFNFEGLIGSAFADFLEGDDDDNELRGAAGDDELVGLAGDDLLIGEDGDDIIQGEDGDDRLIGGLGNDALDGGDGSDTADFNVIVAAITVDLLAGTAFGQGNDTFESIENIIGSLTADTITGDDEDNILDGNDGNDVLNGGEGDDTLLGQTGNDRFIGSPGNDVFNGTGDFAFNEDTADFSGDAAAISVDLAAGTASSEEAGNDTLIDIENVLGTDFDDEIAGDGQNNDLTGGLGDDLLSGASGNDVLFGDDGDDELNGGALNDQLNGGAGRDILNGDAGFDTLRGGQGEDVLRGGSENDVLLGGNDGDQLFGDGGDDELFGEGGDDLVDGGAGDDIINLGLGNDTLIGGAGEDGIDASGVAGVIVNLAAGTIEKPDAVVDTVTGVENVFGSGSADQLIGDAAANFLFGANGDDIINGGGGNDTILPGTGNDLLTGGGGVDIFGLQGAFEGAFQADGTVGALAPNVITDFAGDLFRLDNTAFNFTNFEGALPSFNFRVVPDFDGTNSGMRAQESYLVFDPISDTVSFDNDSGQNGFSTLFTLQDGAIVTAGNFDIGDVNAFV